MFITPFMAAVLVGTFWAGVGTAAVVNHDGLFMHPAARQDVVISATTDDHIAACQARYRSYDESTDSYISSRDGQWHKCML
ncbi:MAG TPA: BA14K family protein [Devosia sp.]|nr:BA14K family protein [Devosia sp.]